MNATEITDNYSKILKQNVGLSLSIEECKEFVSSIVNECVIQSKEDNRELVETLTDAVLKYDMLDEEDRNRYIKIIQKHTS